MSRRWRSILLVAALILGPILLVAVWIEITASRRWAEALRRTEEIEKELAVPLPGRRPLRGEVLPGNAWDDYAAATGGSPADDLELEALLRRNSSWDKARTVVAALRTQIEILRRGASRRDSIPLPGVSVNGVVFKAALVSGRFLAEGAQPEDAIPSLTDLLRVGLDQASGPRFLDVVWGYEKAFRAADELQTLLSQSALPREAAERLESELLILETSIPPAGRLFLMERVVTARSANAEGTFGFGLALGGISWRHGFSSRLFLASSLQHLESWGRTLKSLDGEPWGRIQELHQAAVAEAERSENSYLRLQASLYKVESYAWNLRARLRVARAAARYRATGEKAELDDPFGGTLQWDDRGVRSRGLTEASQDDIVLRFAR